MKKAAIKSLLAVVSGDFTPGKFLAYRPAARWTDLWDETVRIPCQRALTEQDPARRTLSDGQAGEIYQSLARLGAAATEEKR